MEMLQLVGITDLAQKRIAVTSFMLKLKPSYKTLDKDAVFGTVEAVKLGFRFIFTTFWRNH